MCWYQCGNVKQFHYFSPWSNLCFLLLILIAVGLWPKVIEIVKHKWSYGSKILPLGRERKLFRRSFSTRDGEKLLRASRCYIYTTAVAIAGILFISTERLSFCSDRSLKTYSSTGELLKFQYKVGNLPSVYFTSCAWFFHFWSSILTELFS